MAPALLDHIVPLGKHSPVPGGGLGLVETRTRSAPHAHVCRVEVDGALCLGIRGTAAAWA